MLTGKEPDELSTKSLDIALILHADHELNASTFAARVAAATETDIHSATVAAIGALKGPLHGGANQEVIKMLLNIGEASKADAYLQKMFESHEKVMGFGHRVYKTEDPRAFHLRQMSESLGKKLGQEKWFEISKIVEDHVKKDKGLNANVDFYSASVYYMLGIPIDLFTPIFAISRMAGWAAHVLEQLGNNRLIRPRAEYTGKSNLKYASIDQRKG
jgi:citrate synthase